MKKIIRFLIIIILLLIIAALIIFFFNPGNLRNKIVGNMINSYLNSKITDYQVTDKENIDTSYDHPALSESQEAVLYDMGVDVSQLPATLDDKTRDCLASTLSPDRLKEILAGDAPSPMEIFKAKPCLE